MIITCPSCSTRYSMEPTALGSAGRTVRCSKCGNTWTQAPPADLPRRVDLGPANDPVSYVPAPGAGLPARIEPRAARRGGFGGLFLTLVILGLVAAGLWFGRNRIVAQWPDAAQLYALAGVETRVIGAGLRLANLRLTRRQQSGADLVVIEGDVVNESGAAQPVPAMLATLRDGANASLENWTFELPKQQLAPGEKASFRTTAADPPDGTQRITLTFTEADLATTGG